MLKENYACKYIRNINIYISTENKSINKKSTGKFVPKMSEYCIDPSEYCLWHMMIVHQHIPKISACTWWNCQATHYRLQIEITYYPNSLLLISAGILPRVSSKRLKCPSITRDHKAATKTTGPNSAHAPPDATYIRIHALLQSTPGPVSARNVTSRGVSCTSRYTGRDDQTR